jgi:hypothetical protein
MVGEESSHSDKGAHHNACHRCAAAILLPLHTCSSYCMSHVACSTGHFKEKGFGGIEYVGVGNSWIRGTCGVLVHA